MQSWIQPTILENGHAKLEPLSPDHAEELFAAATPETFRYFSRGPSPWTVAGMQDLIERLLGPARTVPFTISDPVSDKRVGITTFLNIDPVNRGVEIGWTWLTPDCRATRVNPAMKHLMLEHAFEDLEAIRVSLRTDERNIQSRAAIAKLGAQYEGILRHAVIMRDDFRRSTAVYSILADEWPRVRENLRLRFET